VPGEGDQRTYGIWGFIVAFTLMCVVGVVLLVFGGSSGSGTTQLSTPQTLPEQASTTTTAADDADAAADGAGSTTTTTSSGQAGSGQADANLPDGVTQVLSEGGTTSFVFRGPAGVDASSLSTFVAPTAVRLSEDGRTATLTVGCAQSSEEFLAQVLVSESDTSLTIAAISVAPPDGAPCASPATTREVELELPEPLGDRSLSVIPRGTPVPQLGNA
jgi:hypothetical protein